MAVRGEGADFLALSSQLAHFCRTLGSPTTLLSLLHGLEEAWRTGDPSPAVPECDLWLRSSTVFLRSLPPTPPSPT